jgi:transmembrane sensor
MLSAADVEDAAADWLVRNQAAPAVDEAARFRAWLAADPRHEAAYRQLEKTWIALNGPRQAGGADNIRRELRWRATRRTRRRRAWALGTITFATAAALAVVVFLPHEPARSPAAAPANTVAVLRPNTQTLPDGSKVEFNADAEIRVNFSPALRAVELVRGEALFSVTKDPARPFVVTASAVQVRAVGTEFSVRHGADQVRVLVTEGTVAVDHAAPPEPPSASTPTPAPTAPSQFVTAGELAVVPANATPSASERRRLAPADIASALAWRSKRVEFSGASLSAAAAIFNRQNRLQLTFADQATGQLKITGIAWTDDPESFVRLIEAGLDLASERQGDSIVLRPIAAAQKSK